MKRTEPHNTSIYGWKYRMRAESSLNKASNAASEVEGFLLRFAYGFACVQPWPQFGHGTADDAWRALQEGHGTPLTDEALRCCRIDGEARQAGVSLWSGCVVPPSHATLTNESQAEQAYANGFRLWKVKCGIDDLAMIAGMMERFPDVKFRLDCNETASPDRLLPWVREHAKAIDFIEDPYPHGDHSSWNELSQFVPLAMDRNWSEGAPWLPVWKPAWGGITASMPMHRTVVTSGMDHPVGQAWAAWNAAQIGTKMVCGLRTEHLFETNAFSEAMGTWQAEWPCLQGTGWGWDNLLEELPWTKIR